MASQKPVPAGPDKNLIFLSEFFKRFRLVWLLFKDPRISLWIKSVLPLSLIYLVSPIDFIPAALFPVVGGLDDLGVILLGMALFVKLSPPEIVEDYENQLEYGDLYRHEDAVDTTYRVVDED
ncbi:MAG: DUF1232 domain-containing protein [Chloroflexota bacterium]